MDLDPLTPGRVFCVGAAGSGVRALAELLHGFGWEVSGTDRAKPDVLARLHARGPAVTHDPGGRTWIGAKPDLLLFSPAVPPSDPARRRAAAEGVPACDHVELLAALTRRIETVAVAGTHGKSSTAAALVHLLRAGDRRVAGFVGAEPADPADSFADPAPDLLVAEACEWNRHFLRLAPTHALVTGVEFDHPDTYRNAADLRAAFAEFRSKLPPGGVLVEGEEWSRDHQGASLRASASAGPRATLPNGRGSSRFGSNAALAAEMTVRLGVDSAAVAAALPAVPRLRRRCERLGTWRGRTIIDDYAHHPTALRWLRTRVSANAALAFQPHQLARTRALFADFAAALRGWPVAAVLPVFPARERASEDECRAMSRRLAGAAGAAFLPSLDDVPGWADSSTRPGDALVLAGAGDVDRARDLFIPPG